MKKFCLMLLVLLLLSSVTVSAKTVTATIPDYTFILGNSSIYYQDSEYPLLSYKDITYFPMTYDYCRLLNLAISWDNTAGLYIAYQPDLNYYHNQLPAYPITTNKKYNRVTVPEYPIYINGKPYDNKTAKYPFLNFRGVTYCPVTWDLAYGEFGWTTSFVPGTFSVSAHSATYYSTYQYANSLPDGFTVYRYEQVPIVMEDGKTAIMNKPFYEKFDYATKTLVPYPEGGEIPVRQYIRHDLQVIEGDVYLHKGQLLPEVKFHGDGENVTSVSNSLYALEYKMAGTSFYEINCKYELTYTDGSLSKGQTTYSYVEVYGQLKFIGKDIYIPTAVNCADGNIYFDAYHSATNYMWTERSSAHKLYRLSPNGEITLINDLYPQYGCMELLGEVNGIMYLRCVWMPPYENGGSFRGVSEKCYEVSPLNDGYFTYNGKDLVKLYNYIYADRSILSPTGEIYGMFRRLNQIKQIN